MNRHAPLGLPWNYNNSQRFLIEILPNDIDTATATTLGQFKNGIITTIMKKKKTNRNWKTQTTT